MSKEKKFDKLKFASRLHEIMKEYGDTIYSLAEHLSLSPSLISRYTSGEHMPKAPTIEMMSERYKVNPVWLMGAETEKYLIKGDTEKRKRIPLIKGINCNKSIYDEENIEGYECVDDKDLTFAIRVKNDTMTGARIYNGDIVYIREQASVESGDIAAVCIDNEIELKRFYKLDGTIILKSENPVYKDIILKRKDMKEQNIRILGKAKSFKSNL